METHVRIVGGALLLLALPACAHHPRASARQTPADTGAWRTEAVSSPTATPGTSAVLTSVQATPAAGYDRVAFRFAGSLPAYHVAFESAPPRHCGSGDLVELPGQALLVVTFRGAAAHDEQGRATIDQRDLRPHLVALRALTLFCDFEGEVSWALALARATRFRVAQPAGSARLLLDIEHPR